MLLTGRRRARTGDRAGVVDRDRGAVAAAEIAEVLRHTQGRPADRVHRAARNIAVAGDLTARVDRDGGRERAARERAEIVHRGAGSPRERVDRAGVGVTVADDDAGVVDRRGMTRWSAERAEVCRDPACGRRGKRAPGGREGCGHNHSADSEAFQQVDHLSLVSTPRGRAGDERKPGPADSAMV